MRRGRRRRSPGRRPWRAPRELAALLHDRRPAGAVDRAVHAAAARELRVGRVDDRVDGLLGDVALQQRDPRHGRIVGASGHQPHVHGDRVRQRVADRRRGDDLLVHELQRLGVRVGVDAHADVEARVARVPGRQAQERPQVELAGDPDLEVVDGDAAGRELRDVADRQAVAERRRDLLDRVRARCCCRRGPPARRTAPARTRGSTPRSGTRRASGRRPARRWRRSAGPR